MGGSVGEETEEKVEGKGSEIPFPVRDINRGVGRRASSIPVAPAVRNDNLLASPDTANGFQTSRAIANVGDELGIGFDTSP